MQQQDPQNQTQGSNLNPPPVWARGMKRKSRMLLFTAVFILLCAGLYFGIRRQEVLAPQELLNDVETPINQELNVNVEVPAEKLIVLESPAEGSVISSPLKLTGNARGVWYFEATFPVVLVDWDGRIIAESFAQVQIDPADEDGAGWMTEEFVLFVSTVEFESPYKEGDPDFMKRGAIILRKDNPSGLPEYDDAYEIPIFFSE